MKLFPSKKSVASLVIAAAGMAATVAPASSLAAIGSLSVTGTGQMAVQPDTAVVRLTVEKTDPIPAVARAGVEKPVASLYDGIKKLEIKKDQVKAENISLFPQYHYTEGKRILQGYTARRVVNVNIDDFTLIPKVIDLAMDSGFNGVESLNYDLRDKSAVRKKVRELAVLDATEKAGALADGFKVKLHGINAISYGNNDMDGARPVLLKGMALNAVDEAAQDEAIYEPEQLKFSDSVDVQFRIDDGFPSVKKDD